MISQDDLERDEQRAEVAILADTLLWPFAKIAEHMGLAGENDARILYAEWWHANAERVNAGAMVH